MSTSPVAKLVTLLLKRGSLFLLALPFLFANHANADSWDWKADAGLNYDYISHDYYLLTIDTLSISSDSLQELHLYSDRIDERGINLRLKLERTGNTKVSVTNRVFLTNQKIRDLLNVGFEWGLLRLDTETDLKSYSPEEQFSLYDDRLENRSRLSLAVFDRNRWRAEISEEFEYSGYRNPSSSVFGYRQYETRLRLLRDLGDFSQANFTIRYDRRDAYDSTLLSYNRLIVESGIDRIGSRVSVQGNLFAERKNYNRGNTEDDYFYIYPYLDLDLSLSDQWAFVPQLEAHYYNYDTQDLATFSHVRTESKALLEYRYTLLSNFKFGVGEESFLATSREYADEDFHSIQAIAGFESLASTAFTISLDSEFGHRNYTSGNDTFYSDNWFLKLDLFSDWRVAQSLRFSIIGSTDFEYHDQKEDDAFLYLLSANMTYQIR